MMFMVMIAIVCSRHGHSNIVLANICMTILLGHMYMHQMCCSCGGGTDVPANPGTPDEYEFGWVLNDTDADDLCTSNSYDCNNVCDGPGVINALGDGECCNSGAIDCTNTCDGILVGTNYDGLGTDCNGVCNGLAESLLLGWNSGSYDYETSFLITDSAGNTR